MPMKIMALVVVRMPSTEVWAINADIKTMAVPI